MERADTKFASQLENLQALPGYQVILNLSLRGSKMGKCQLAWQRHQENSMYVQPTVSPSETQEVMSFTESSYP